MGTKGKTRDISGDACNHYVLYEKDFELARSLNHNAHRFSIEWSGIEPKRGELDLEAISHYKNVLISLKNKNIIPIVTLHHGTNPKWIFKMGGWENRQIVNYFKRYAKLVVENLKDYVDFWITINEPIVYIASSYLYDAGPPGKKNPMSAAKVFMNMIKAHKEAYKIIHNVYRSEKRKPKVSISKNIVFLGPEGTRNPLDLIKKRLIMDGEFVQKAFISC